MIVEDLHLGQRVALKFLPQDLARHHQQALKRFKLEARTASSLNHPNICTIYEIVEADGEYFIAMELVEGEPLDRYLSRHRPDLQELLDSGIQIADALDAAHSKGVIHRDIEPGNIVITPRGQAKILDFGLAKLVAGRKTIDLRWRNPGHCLGIPHFAGDGGRHYCFHVSRASSRERARHAERSVFFRRGALSDGDRQASFRRRHCRDHL